VAVAYLAGSEGEIDRMAAEIRRVVDGLPEAMVGKWDDGVVETLS